MTNKTTTERPKGAPEFDPTLPCDTRDPGRFRRILCTDLNDENYPILYESADGCVYQTSKDGLNFCREEQSNIDLVNVWPVLREGWTCEFIPADTEPIRKGEHWGHLVPGICWIVKGEDYEMAAVVEEEENYQHPRLRLIPPAEEGTAKESEDADKQRIEELEAALDRILEANPEQINGTIVEWMQQVAAEALGRD